MSEKYAIIDQENGFLVNVVLWDGDLSKWEPPNGTTAIRLTDIDISSLIPAPTKQNILITAEDAVSQYFTPYKIQALQQLEMSLKAADKPLGDKMTACKEWLETVMITWVTNPQPAPSEYFGSPAATFEEASSEAINTLTNK